MEKISFGEPREAISAEEHERIVRERREAFARAAEEDRVRRRQEAKATADARMLAQVPRKFHAARLSTYQPKNQTQQAALCAVVEWIDRVVSLRPAMLALIGGAGLGKSHLLWGAAWELYEKHNTWPFCLRWYNFTRDLKWGRGGRDERGNAVVRPEEVAREWYAASPCLIDELRPTSGTETDATELAKYALNAYDDEQSVLLTTNMASLEDVMGGPAADRFHKITLLGTSYR